MYITVGYTKTIINFFFFLQNREKKINREKKNIIEYPVKPKIEQN